MIEKIRYRVLIRDPRVKPLLVSGLDGTDISGKATAGEIVERLKNDLGDETFDSVRTLEWLESQDPADAGDSAVLQLNSRLELEIVIKSA